MAVKECCGLSPINCDCGEPRCPECDGHRYHARGCTVFERKLRAAKKQWRAQDEKWQAEQEARGTHGIGPDPAWLHEPSTLSELNEQRAERAEMRWNAENPDRVGEFGEPRKVGGLF